MESRFPLKNIPRYPTTNYSVTIAWNDLDHILCKYRDDYQLDLNPDFQRGHVWTQDQKERYVEHLLMGGQSGKDIYFNAPGWDAGFIEPGKMVCVDGLQRITAAQGFMMGEIKAFNHYINQFGEQGQQEYVKRYIGNRCWFNLHIGSFIKQSEILNWYIMFNSGGTPHNQEEIDRVRKLYEKALELER